MCGCVNGLECQWVPVAPAVPAVLVVVSVGTAVPVVLLVVTGGPPPVSVAVVPVVWAVVDWIVSVDPTVLSFGFLQPGSMVRTSATATAAASFGARILCIIPPSRR